MEKIKKYDKGNSIGSLKQLSDQFEQAWREIQSLNFPEEFKQVKNIVISGMGGSAYSYYVINSIFRNQLKIPLVLSNTYGLPKFVNKDSLVIASSYSGTTEETITGAEQALKRDAKLTFVSSGGKLRKIAQLNKLTGYFFDPKHNPSKQPRMGQGYMLLGTIGILHQLGLVRLDNQTVSEAVKWLKTEMKSLSRRAQLLVPKIKDRYLIYIAAEHLAGNAHIIRNQTNETAKQFAMYALIPELNHHLMEGLTYPEKEKPLFIFLNSTHYSTAVKKRFELTEDIVKQNGASTIMLNFEHPTRFSEFVSVLEYGGYLTFYLAMEHGLDPAEIPWVDYFKNKLKG